MPVTLKHIADELGVSQMTVSRALRGVSGTNAKTRQIVHEAAVRLRYQPIGGVMMRPTVRSGKGNHSLRVLLPTVSRRIGAAGGSWWLDRMAQAMRSRLELSNGRLVEQHFADFDDLVAECHRGRFHGIVLRQPLPNVWVKRLLELAPVIYAVEFDHQLGLDSVYSNEHRSAAMVLSHLWSRGHRQIAWFGILDRNSPYQVVSDAPDEGDAADRQAMSVHGARHAAWANIAYCQLVGRKLPLILVERDWLTQSLDVVIANGMERIMACRPHPTAVVCSCDPAALLLVEQLKQSGLKVPKDISVISYGATDEAKLANPSITSVEMPMETIGRVIPELIERRRADPHAVAISLQFETTLCEGASVGTAPAKPPARP